MPELTFGDLSKILEENKKIHLEVHMALHHYLQTYHPKGWNLHDGAKKYIEQNHYLIEAPIDDATLGGFIRTTNTKRFICYINSAQPRMYQNFVVFHELYHLITNITQFEKMHFVDVEIDPNINERKADYFASLLLLDEHELKAFFTGEENKNENVLTKILLCMHAFKAPYKAILIRLYELNLIHLEDLSALFDKKINFAKEFQTIGKDTYILEPSNVINFKALEGLFQKNPLPTIAQSSNQTVLDEIRLFFSSLRKEK